MREPLDKGVVTARDASRLSEGELVKAQGGVYYPGDDRLWKQNGRSVLGDTQSGVKVDGVALAVFDTTTDQYLALSGGNLYKAPVTEPVTFAVATAATGSILSAAHEADRWYLSTGGSENWVLESDGTLRAMSLKAPVETPTAVAQQATSNADITASSHDTPTDFVNPERAYDSNDANFAQTTLDAIAQDAIQTNTLVLNFASDNEENDRLLIVDWSLQQDTEPPETGNVTFTFDAVGVSPVSFAFYSLQNISSGRYNNSYALPNGLQIDASTLTISFQKEFSAMAPTLKINEVTITDGGSDPAFALTGAYLYAVTEYDETRGLESARSPTVSFGAAGTSLSFMQLLLPTTPVNSNATHYRVYKSPVGGTVTQLALADQVDIDATLWIDQFASEIQQAILYAHIFIGDTPYDRDVAAPAFHHIRYYDGQLIGFPVANTRAVRYSVPGFPESWPQIYEISRFNLEENDVLLDGLEVGGSFMFFSEAAVFRLDRFPQVIGTESLDSPVVKLAGAPGAVGREAVAEVAFKGQQMAAWISHDGVYATTGHTAERISDNIDWRPFESLDKSQWVLHFDQARRLLVMSYSTAAGANTLLALIHLHPTHTASGQPKWTLPTPAALSCLASGFVSGRRRLFSGHTTDGKVYLEDDPDAGTDASNSIDGNGTHRLDVQSRRRRAERQEYEIHDGFIMHTDFGAGESATLTHTVGRDASQFSAVKTRPVSLANAEDTQFDVGMAGNWSELRLVHDGEGLGALADFFESMMVGSKAGAQGQ